MGENHEIVSRSLIPANTMQKLTADGHVRVGYWSVMAKQDSQAEYDGFLMAVSLSPCYSVEGSGGRDR